MAPAISSTDKLLNDRDLFYRIEVGGRPMGMVMASDDRTTYVANFLRNTVQQVDIESREVVREIQLAETPPLDRGSSWHGDLLRWSPQS